MLKRLVVPLVIALTALAVASCKSDSKTAAGGTTALATINDHCPVLSFKKVKADAPVVEYKGHRVGFCCDKCPAKWETWPDEKKDAFVARQAK